MMGLWRKMRGGPNGPIRTASTSLLDAGDGRRLERFRVADRRPPAPAATDGRLADYLAWRRADLRFDPATGWFGDAAALEPWPLSIDGLTLELRPTASGGLGVYPEHAAISPRVAPGSRSASRGVYTASEGANEPLQVLNLFAHTGPAGRSRRRAPARQSCT